MLWIALHLPALALEAFPGLRDDPHPSVVEAGRRVVAANTAAQSEGIVEGMSVTTARSRWSQLRVYPQQPDAEHRCVLRWAQAALRFTPRVVLRPPSIALEVQSSLRLFGGAAALWNQLLEDGRLWGLTLRMAAAPTLEGAVLWARLHPGHAENWRTPHMHRLRSHLDRLPLAAAVQAWGLPEEQLQLLEGLGLTDLASVKALPRAGLVRRGATAFLERLDRAYGDAPEAWQDYAVPERFQERLEWVESTDRLDRLHQPLQMLLHALEGWLRQRQSAAQVMTLRLVHDSPRRSVHPDTEWVCRLSAPETHAARLHRWFAEHLSRTQLQAPVRAMQLVLDGHQPLSDLGMTPDLAPGLPMGGTAAAALPEELALRRARLLDDLRARLGEERVLQLQAWPDHRPERASRLLPHRAPKKTESSDLLADSPYPGRARPCWLLPQPLPLEEAAGVLRSGPFTLELRSRAERIEAGWFDGEAVCRDYHVAHTSDGRWAWVFRERSATAWYLHGWFA